MLFWNRKEVYLGNAAGFHRCRALLTQHKIQYTYRLENRGSRAVGVRVEIVGRVENTATGLYYVYVHKDNYENARRILREGK